MRGCRSSCCCPSRQQPHGIGRKRGTVLPYGTTSRILHLFGVVAQVVRTRQKGDTDWYQWTAWFIRIPNMRGGKDAKEVPADQVVSLASPSSRPRRLAVSNDKEPSSGRGVGGMLMDRPLLHVIENDDDPEAVEARAMRRLAEQIRATLPEIQCPYWRHGGR